MMLWGTVGGEEIIQVNKILSEIDLVIHDQGLLCLLALEYEGLPLKLANLNYVQHF